MCFFLTWKKNRVPTATTARSFLKLSGALKSKTPIIPPTFDRIEFLFLISEIELPKLGVLEKGGLKMDQNYGSNINLRFEARILMKLFLESRNFVPAPFPMLWIDCGCGRDQKPGFSWSKNQDLVWISPIFTILTLCADEWTALLKTAYKHKS